jgi:hypothetical protein
MLVSVAALAAGAAGARRGALRFGAELRFGAARFALRLAVRLAERFAAFFFEAFRAVDLRDLAIFFAVLRRFLAMRDPPGKWARVF